MGESGGIDAMRNTNATVSTVLLAILVPLSCVTAGSTAFLAYVVYEMLQAIAEAL